jgi:hypothetical protein
MFKKMSAGLATLTAVVVISYVRFLRPWYLRWGATDEEAEQPMPGDEAVARVKYQSTRALTLQAPPAEVWSWLIQMGYGRAGFYSYAWIERALGLRALSNAERILSEFQHLSAGDIIPLEPGGSGYRVAALEPNRLLVLAIDEGDGGIMGNVMKQTHGASTWVFVLHALGSEHTRLIVRWRARLKLRSLKMSPAALVQMLSIEPGEFVMERKMLLGIKWRAERANRQAPDPVGAVTEQQVRQEEFLSQ